MYALFPYAIGVQFALTPFVDPPGALQYAWTARSLALVLASGLGAFLVNYSGFLVVGHLTPVTPCVERACLKEHDS